MTLDINYKYNDLDYFVDALVTAEAQGYICNKGAGECFRQLLSAIGFQNFECEQVSSPNPHLSNPPKRRG